MSLGHGSSSIVDGTGLYVDAANIKSYNGSGNTWFSLTTNRHISLPAGVQFTSTNGGEMYFSGSGQTASASAGVITSGADASWEAVINRETSTNTYNMFLGDWPPYHGLMSTNRFIFSCSIGGVQRTLQGIANKTSGTWYHYTGTIDYNGVNTTMTMYVNGQMEVSSVFPGAPSYTTAVTVGDGRITTWYPFVGKISSVKVYNRSLSADEVVKNYNSIKGRYGI